MPLFFKRERAVRRLIAEYFETTDTVLEEFVAGMRCYCEKGLCPDLSDIEIRVHRAESRADDLRVEIEKTLYRRALLPESRGDILGLLEDFDKMPNIAETAIRMIITQRIEMPPQFRKRLCAMIEFNIDAYRAVRRGADMLFMDPDAVEQTVGPVDKLESASDKSERALISEIFQSDLTAGEKIIFRDLIEMVGDISDKAENVAHRLEIISFKRRI